MASVTLKGRGIKVSAKAFIEVQVDLTGTFQPGCDAWGGGRFEPPTNPPEPDAMEDIEATGLTAVRFRGPDTNLLAGVDPHNPEVRKLLDNILAFLGEESEQALLNEVEVEAV